MLTSEEQHEIDAELARVPNRRAACIEALKVVQKHRRWISDEALADLADYLELPVSELDAVATFYNLLFRRPVGRHVIYVCDSVSCWIVDGVPVQQALFRLLGVGFGETTQDERFTVLPIPCLGTCDHAPALMIDQELHRNVAPAALAALLEKYP